MASVPSTPVSQTPSHNGITPARSQFGLETPTPTRRTSTMSAGLSSEQRKARRAELRQFYGMADRPVPEGEPSPSGVNAKVGNALDIDTPSFDKEAYYDNLVSTSSLADLMRTASKLANDVGDLQGARHDLVYNHHHQLFAAGDTIAHLNSRTPQLLGIMTSLQQSFSEISRLAEEVSLDVPEGDLEEQKLEREMERVRLMIVAEEPSAAIREKLNNLKDSGDGPELEERRKEIEELEALVSGNDSNREGS